MKIIGLTGGIGSGKSTVAKVFSLLGVPIFNSDIEAKLCYQKVEVKGVLKEHFGPAVLKNDQVDFKILAHLVFNNPKELSWLNDVIHPIVKSKFEHWLTLQKTPYIVKEAAILFESGSSKDCDKIITVTCPQDVRIKRVMQRDEVSYDEVLKRIRNQWDEIKKIQLSDYIINNSESELILPQVIKIHQELSR